LAEQGAGIYANLELPPSNAYQQVFIISLRDEKFRNTFGGSIVIYGANVPITLIENSEFMTNYGSQGGSINLYRGGGLYIKNSVFTRD
jgi:hypothetical protein